MTNCNLQDCDAKRKMSNIFTSWGSQGKGSHPLSSDGTQRIAWGQPVNYLIVAECLAEYVYVNTQSGKSFIRSQLGWFSMDTGCDVNSLTCPTKPYCPKITSWCCWCWCICNSLLNYCLQSNELSNFHDATSNLRTICLC